MLDRGLTSLGLTLSQHVDGRTVTPSVVTRGSAQSAGAGDFFEGAASVRDVGLDATAGHRRSVKILNQEGAEVSQKERSQGDTERIEDRTPGY